MPSSCRPWEPCTAFSCPASRTRKCICMQHFTQSSCLAAQSLRIWQLCHIKNFHLGLNAPQAERELSQITESLVGIPTYMPKTAVLISSWSSMWVLSFKSVIFELSGPNLVGNDTWFVRIGAKLPSLENGHRWWKYSQLLNMNIS